MKYYRMNVARGNVTQRLQGCDEHSSLSHSPDPRPQIVGEGQVRKIEYFFFVTNRKGWIIKNL